jgi:hypothetical protein
MNEKYIFEYTDENKFNKLESALKKYNMLAYKKLCFEYYPALKQGELLGEIVSDDEKGTHYALKLPTDSMFSKVHGDVKLHYYVKKGNVIIIDTITPEDILSEGHQSELVTYKGVMVSNENSEKDIFKINLLNMISRQ